MYRIRQEVKCENKVRDMNSNNIKEKRFLEEVDMDFGITCN